MVLYLGDGNAATVISNLAASATTSGIVSPSIMLAKVCAERQEQAAQMKQLTELVAALSSVSTAISATAPPSPPEQRTKNKKAV